MPKIVAWDKVKAKNELSKRLRRAKEARKDVEKEWEINERTIFTTEVRGGRGGDAVSAITSTADIDVGDDMPDVKVNYVFKNYRLIHSQLSANPPSVIPRPTSSDYSDQRKADAADRIIRWSLRKLDLQNKFDKGNVHTLSKGIGFIKPFWNPEKGDMIGVAEDGTVEMEGAIDVAVPNPWNIYVDPDVDEWENVRFVFEAFDLPIETAEYMFPDALEELKEATKFNKENASASREYTKEMPKQDVIRVYQYWEKGLPVNGLRGRFCWCLDDGTPLQDVVASPHAFSTPEDRGIDGAIPEKSPGELPPIAELPYHPFTDVDLPEGIWGKATAAYTNGIQDYMNQFDNVMLDILRAHGVVRILCPEGAEINDDSFTNSSYDVVKYTGSVPPNFMQPMPMPTGMMEMRDRFRGGIDDMQGVNESMFGQQSREMSGFSMQYATNQGNMIRRRLFNKYVKQVENVYNTILNLVREHWDTPRKIRVLGSEQAFQAFDIAGTDVDGGYDLVVEYGASLSLDPTSRREEILTLMPLFEKAGIPPRQMMQLLKLNDLAGGHDLIKLAEARQSEIFREMTENPSIYIAPVKYQDHTAMLNFAYTYVMTAEFKYLPEEVKNLIYQHIAEREEIAATPAASAGEAAPSLVDPAGMPIPPIPPGV